MSQVGGAFVTAVPAIPVGAVEAFAGSSAPNGWLLCNGAETAISAYPALYSVLSTTYGILTNGAGTNTAGTTHFRLPDLRGRVPMGAGTGNQQGTQGSGAIYGGTALTARTAGQFGGDERLQSHSHDTLSDMTASGLWGAVRSTNAGWSGGNINTATTGTGTSANMPPFTVLNYIIKWANDVPRGGMTASWTPPIVTTLPVSPSFGDQVTYAADATNGVYWLLQYDASGTYPWKFIGGSGVTTTTTAYPASMTPASWTSITSGPSWTPPLAGDYNVRHWGRLDIIAPTDQRLVEISPATNTVAASTYYSAVSGNWVTNGGTFRSGWSGERLMSGVLSSEALTLKVEYAVGPVTFVPFYVGMTATPIRVKAA